MRMQVTLF